MGIESDAMPNRCDYCRLTREAVGGSGKSFHLTGGLSTVNNLATIRPIMLELKPERTMGVGMACGGSALTFLLCALPDGGWRLRFIRR